VGAETLTAAAPPLSRVDRDKVFKSRRAPATILFMVLTLVAVVVYWLNLRGPCGSTMPPSSRSGS
jgi:hypothetical protein